MNSLEKSVENWCRSHPDNPDCQYILKGIEESLSKKKIKAKKWRLIATGLLEWEERGK